MTIHRAHPTPSSTPPDVLDVLVVGAGPAGSALAADLVRRGVSVRLVDRAAGPFEGSRAKGVQPRTQEVLDDLGVIEEARAEGAAYPLLGLHLGPVVVPWRMQSTHRVTSDVPYPDALLLPQNRTDAILHRLLGRAGIHVQYGAGFVSCEQDEDAVTTTLSTGERIRSRYLAGADGGASAVRRAVGITFTGATDAGDRMLIVDATVDGLSRDRWHVWPATGGRGTAACPLPGGAQFQVMMRLERDEQPDLDEARIAERFRAATGYALRAPTWSSVFRPNVRLADRYRHDRVLLLGDAAHVHTPAGGQGLNTGVQDAHNLGWKLGQVLAGADPALLDTYEGERRPVAAAVLALSDAIYAQLGKAGGTAGLRRGDAERQLSLSYADGPLSSRDLPTRVARAGTSRFWRRTPVLLRAGDRVPDAVCSAPGVSRLFDVLRGPHFTVLAFGSTAERAVAALGWPGAGARLHRWHVRGAAVAGATGRPGEDGHVGVLVDRRGDLRRRFGVTGDAVVLVRPDGYLGVVAAPHDLGELTRFVGRVAAHGARSAHLA